VSTAAAMYINCLLNTGYTHGNIISILGITGVRRAVKHSLQEHNTLVQATYELGSYWRNNAAFETKRQL
jgi:hypothetical protein